MLRVLHLIPSLSGGAGRATYRIHQCLGLNHPPLEIESRIRCLHSAIEEPSVISGYPSLRSEILAKIQSRMNSFANRQFRGNPSVYHSIGYPGVGLLAQINASPADLVHLHYCGDHLISIEEIAQIRKPLVWTLHDQWAFCGAEHYASISSSGADRFKEGYTLYNRPESEAGPDLNRKTWERKRRLWTIPFQIVAPSRWLHDCVKESNLMKNWPVHVVPHPINTDLWKRIDKTNAREFLGLPTNQIILLFGVDHGCAKLTKGADLLMRSLEIMKSWSKDTSSILLAVFGQDLSPQNRPKNIPYLFLGRLDDQQLRMAYSAADVLVMPSRVEAFGLTAAEAQSCGTPVVAFRTSGLQDVVEHRITGALADPFDPQALAEAIHWVIAERERYLKLALAARKKAVDRWDESVVRSQYLDVYLRTLGMEQDLISS